jgi:hypothetical protein
MHILPFVFLNDRKLATYIAMAGTSFHCVLQMDYGENEHCFSNVQRWYKKKVDGLILGNSVVGVGAKDLEAVKRQIQTKDGGDQTIVNQNQEKRG